MNIVERLDDARSVLMNLDLSVDTEVAYDALLKDAAAEIRRLQAREKEQQDELYGLYEALEARMQQLEQALTLSKEALTATIQRVGTGYDWNVDPDCVTRLQGDAFEAITNALGQSDA